MILSLVMVVLLQAAAPTSAPAASGPLGDYAGMLENLVRKHWVPPPSARRGVRGSVVVHFRVDARGNVSALRAETSDAPKSQVRAALDAVRTVGRVPPPPQTDDDGFIHVAYAFHCNVDAPKKATPIPDSP